jgi:integrase
MLRGISGPAGAYRELYLKEVIPAGPNAWARAEQARADLVRQVREGRQPRTNATLVQLLGKHVAPLIGDRPGRQRQRGGPRAEVLESFYAELRRCRDHCHGRPSVSHHAAGEHACNRRCRRHVCTPLAAWAIRHIHYLISGAYETAIRWGWWVAVNPLRGVCKPAAPKPDPRPPTADQAAALINRAGGAGSAPWSGW